MSSELAVFEPNQRAIAEYLGLNPARKESHAVVAVCDRYGFDPLLKHVIVIPGQGVYITRDGLLNVAHRSEQLDGIVIEDEGENDAEWWATAVVYRKDMKHGFRYRGRYSKAGKNRAYGPEMAVKCAEAHALRRAFDVTGLPIVEEMGAGVQARPSRPQAAFAPLRTSPDHTPSSQDMLDDSDDDLGLVDEATGEIVG